MELKFLSFEDLLFEIANVKSAIKEIEKDIENCLDLFDPYAELEELKKQLAELLQEKERRTNHVSLHNALNQQDNQEI